MNMLIRDTVAIYTQSINANIFGNNHKQPTNEIHS